MSVALLTDLYLTAHESSVRIQGRNLHCGVTNPFMELAEKIRSIAGVEALALSLAKEIGYKSEWRSGPKGTEELKVFFDLKRDWLELIGIAWEFRNMPEYAPFKEEMRAVVSFCHDVFTWAMDQSSKLKGGST